MMENTKGDMQSLLWYPWPPARAYCKAAAPPAPVRPKSKAHLDTKPSVSRKQEAREGPNKRPKVRAKSILTAGTV